MYVIDTVVSVTVVLAALLFFKYVWMNAKMELFESAPAAYQDPNKLPWWYVGETCRYKRRN